MGPRAVINAAAWTAVDKAEAEEAAATVVNGDAPGAMARACAAAACRFCMSPPIMSLTGRGRALCPDHPTGPLGAYGRTKLAGEDGGARRGGPHDPADKLGVFGAWREFREDHAAAGARARTA
jgi:dTDP-4-dehydrorhamnose reductase